MLQLVEETWSRLWLASQLKQQYYQSAQTTHKHTVGGIERETERERHTETERGDIQKQRQRERYGNREQEGEREREMQSGEGRERERETGILNLTGLHRQGRNQFILRLAKV